MGLKLPEEMEKEYHLVCGKILSLNLTLEGTLNFFLSNYFAYPQDHKTFVLGDFFVESTFRDRIALFKEISKREISFYNNVIFNEKETKEITKLMNEVREMRNRIAHHQSIYDLKTETITLNNGKSITKEQDNIPMNEELVKSIERKVKIATEAIIELHNKINQKRQKQQKSLE